MFVFVYDCVVVSDLLLVEKVEKKGVGMGLVSIGRKWDRYRYDVLRCEVRIGRKDTRKEKKKKKMCWSRVEFGALRKGNFCFNV